MPNGNNERKVWPVVSEFSFHHHGKGRVEPSKLTTLQRGSRARKREAQDKIQCPRIDPFMMDSLQLGIASRTSQKNVQSVFLEGISLHTMRKFPLLEE